MYTFLAEVIIVLVLEELSSMYAACVTRIYTGSQQSCASLFLSELRQISINFGKFWWADGKAAEIVCCVNIFHIA